MKGLLLGWFFGVLNICKRSSLSNRKCVDWSKPWSKERRGRLYFRQFPVNLSSSLVWILVTWNLAEGPTGLLDNHMNKSFCLRCSKNMQLLHDFSKHNSSITSTASFLLTLDSSFVFGIISVKSLTRWRMRPAIPLEQSTSVLWRFFHSLEAGSGSLNALKSSSGSISFSSSIYSFYSSSEATWSSY